MTIKQQGGIFGRNPSFNDVEAESLTIAGNAVPDASTILVDGDIGSTVQGYDADTAKYDDVTANFTGTLQNGGSNVVVDTDIGSSVQAYDADTTKNDAANVFTENQSILNGIDSTLFLGKGAEGADGVTKIKSYQSGADTDQLGLVFFVHTSGSGSSPTNEAVRIDHNLRLDMVGGGNILLNSGAGIDFSATSGTGTSELFDDYEEGTFTPAYQNVTGGSWTYSSQVGSYTKVGRLVTARGDITVSAGSGLSGNIEINLPYSSSANTTGTLMVSNLSKTVDSQLTLFTVGANTRIYEFRNNGAYAAKNYANLGSVHTLFFNVTYEV